MKPVNINVPDSAIELTKEIYEDALQSATIESGKTLATLTKFVNTLLTPVKILNESVETHANAFLDSIHRNYKKIPADKRVPIETCILGPAMEDMKYSISNQQLRELYVNILSNAMNSDCSNYPYRSFLEVIRQLSPLEARMFKEIFCIGCDMPVAQIGFSMNPYEVSPEIEGTHLDFQYVFNFSFEHLSLDVLNICIDNLVHLGLLRVDMQNFLLPLSNYDYVMSTESYKLKELELAKSTDGFKKIKIRKGYMTLTSFGESFYQVCVSD